MSKKIEDLVSCNLRSRGYKIFDMSPDIVPADKELRKKLILFLALVTIGFLALEPHIKGYMDPIDQLSKKHPELAYKKTMLLLKWAMGVVSLLLLSMGVYLILLARRTLRSGPYPPPGMRVTGAICL
jgi:hypothetical protein